MKERWANDKIRLKMIKGMKESGKDPERRAKISMMLTERWLKDSLYREKMINVANWKKTDKKFKEKMSKIMTERWKSLEYRDEVSKRTIELWKEPEYRNKMNKILREPERRYEMSEMMTEKWETSEFREKTLKGMKKAWENPELGKKVSKIRMEQWKSPEFREKRSGGNCHFWKGGVSFEPYPIEFNNEFKRRIRERDNYICGVCGKGIAKHVHHINYDKEDLDPTNMVTLHGSCHGKTGFDRDGWEEFFTLRPFAMIFYSENLPSLSYVISYG